MDDENLYQRVEPGDPRQCQGTTSKGQCRLKAVDGTNFCICHGGYHQAKSNEKSAMRRMLAAQWRAEVGELADSSDVKSLNNEIGILRMQLVKIMNSCKTDQDLLMRSASISDLTVKIQKVVDAANRLDTQLGVMLDKTQLTIFGQKVIEIVSTYIKDSDILQQFATDLVAAMAQTTRPQGLRDRGVMQSGN